MEDSIPKMKARLTEKILLQTFDLQRFAASPRLQAVIDAAHAQTASRALSDGELDFVAAAGEQSPPHKPKEPRT